ncbi:MAG: hypothetical protein Q4P34_02350 [Tissierellia bacterium]|nr:hypothetical protein [Tissierellia bacterium]
MINNSGFFETDCEKSQKKAFLEAIRVYFKSDVEFNVRLKNYINEIDRLSYYKDALKALDEPYELEELNELLNEAEITAINEDLKYIFVYDDNDAFTDYRRITLENYPDDLDFGYPIHYWIRACKKKNVKTVTALQRAFIDMIVDIEGTLSGFTVIRIEHGEFDWNKNAREIIHKLLENSKLGSFIIKEDE